MDGTVLAREILLLVTFVNVHVWNRLFSKMGGLGQQASQGGMDPPAKGSQARMSYSPITVCPCSGNPGNMYK